MSFTDEQKKAIEAWWKRHNITTPVGYGVRVGRACEWCSATDTYEVWQLVSAIMIGVPDKNAAPPVMLLVRCSKCGHVVPFDAAAVGLPF